MASFIPPLRHSNCWKQLLRQRRKDNFQCRAFHNHSREIVKYNELPPPWKPWRLPKHEPVSTYPHTQKANLSPRLTGCPSSPSQKHKNLPPTPLRRAQTPLPHRRHHSNPPDRTRPHLRAPTPLRTHEPRPPLRRRHPARDLPHGRALLRRMSLDPAPGRRHRHSAAQSYWHRGHRNVG